MERDKGLTVTLVVLTIFTIICILISIYEYFATRNSIYIMFIVILFCLLTVLVTMLYCLIEGDE